MKLRTILACFAALSLAASCSYDKFEYGGPGSGYGELSFSGFSLDLSEEMNKVTKASEAADDNYMLFLYDSGSALVWSKNYGEVKAMKDGMSLPAGSYTLEVRSTASAVPAAKFSAPVYGTTAAFDIEASKTTALGTLTCTLLQSAVSVGYNDSFLEDVTGDGVAMVEVTSGSPLEYALTYREGNTPSYERRIGYFAVNNGENTTMTVSYKGSIEGKTQKMTATISGVKARDWHIITFVKKVEASGDASFGIVIDGLVADAVLDNDVPADEEGDGYDPEAPTGDGGIDLVSTCDYDITGPITVPASGDFNLTMQALVPNGTRKFTVLIESTNTTFIESVELVGGTTLDLINPSDEAMGVFDIVPFPHGSELSGATSIDFNLSAAQVPLLAFQGTHTFTMNVTDNKGCRKSIPIVLVVE